MPVYPGAQNVPDFVPFFYGLFRKQLFKALLPESGRAAV
jgi:hypothetical protein